MNPTIEYTTPYSKIHSKHQFERLQKSKDSDNPVFLCWCGAKKKGVIQ